MQTYLLFFIFIFPHFLFNDYIPRNFDILNKIKLIVYSQDITIIKSIYFCLGESMVKMFQLEITMDDIIFISNEYTQKIKNLHPKKLKAQLLFK